MITITVGIGKLDHIKEAKKNLQDVLDVMNSEIKVLEETPRHLISAESFTLSHLNLQAGKISGAIKHLDKFLKEAESDFTTKDEVASSISNSQPYNYGSRENY
jgi:hypothetical protein